MKNSMIKNRQTMDILSYQKTSTLLNICSALKLMDFKT